MQSIKPALIAALTGKVDQSVIDRLMIAKDFVFDIPQGDVGIEILEPAYLFSKNAADLGVFRLPFDSVFYQYKSVTLRNQALLLQNDKTGNSAYITMVVAENAGGFSYFFGKDIPNGKVLTDVAYMIRALTGLLRTKGVPTRIVKPSRQERRAAERKGTFTHEYTVLDLTGVVAEGGSGRGIPANRRLHWRRGHFRRLVSGKITSVAPHLVGDKAAGCVEHDYTLRC